jgi:hypothetical protein
MTTVDEASDAGDEGAWRDPVDDGAYLVEPSNR